MASPNRNFRNTSGPWGRLRSFSTDPLEAVGLPSKGDTKLLDRRAQETYYTAIVKRYTTFCGMTGNSDNLDRAFASLNLNESSSPPKTPETPRLAPQTPPTQQNTSPPTTKNKKKPSSPPTKSKSGTTTSPLKDKKGKPNPNVSNPDALNAELSTILMALRKLREALVATSRIDAFAQQAYLFSIRASILVQNHESYHPALLHLLYRIHPINPLSSPELHECVGYLILDLACRQHDLGRAYATKARYKFSDRRVELILKALVQNNWYAFWRLRQAVNGYQTRLLQPAEREVRSHALKCFGRAYFSVEKPYVERSADMSFEELVQGDMNVGWTLEGDKVIIRKPKTK